MNENPDIRLQIDDPPDSLYRYIGVVSPEPDLSRFSQVYWKGFQRLLTKTPDQVDPLFEFNKLELFVAGLVRDAMRLDDIRLVRDNFYLTKIYVKQWLLRGVEYLDFKRGHLQN